MIRGKKERNVLGDEKGERKRELVRDFSYISTETLTREKVY